MARTRPLYPPSPQNVPEGLTEIHGSYRLCAYILLASVFVFFLLYLGLLFGAGYLVYLGVSMPVGQRTAALDVTLKILFGLGGALVALFLIKGFFRRHRRGRSINVEVTAEEHPRLFDFIERLCAEVGARTPRRVYLTFEVNAAASHNCSFLTLFRPARHDLILGLGLINQLNLSEFKAVLAHEFGHFGQGGTRLDSYVYLAARITGDMIVGQDAFDEAIERWKQAEAPLSWPAYGIYGVTWCLTKLFYGIFFLTFLLQRALSREMEFHADRVAASVTGSDAIVHALKRILFAEATLRFAINRVAYFAEQGRFSDDVFLHQNHAASEIRKEAKDPTLGEPPPLPEDPHKTSEVFDPADEAELPVMWLDHPPNWQREEHVKEQYVRTEFDERSPWLLFDNAEELRSRVTYRMHRALLRVPKGTKLTPAAEIQGAVEAEVKERTYAPRYHGLYDDRIINPGELGKTITEVSARPWAPDQIAAAHVALYDEQAKQLAEAYRQHREERMFLDDVAEKRVKLDEGRFEFRGKVYHRKQAKQWLEIVEKDLEQEHERVRELDRRVFLVHYQMALHVGEGHADELVKRYRFHLDVQEVWKNLRDQWLPLDASMAILTGSGPEMTEGAFFAARELLRMAHGTLKECLRRSEEIYLPRLENVEEGQQLNRYLFGKSLVDGLSDYDFAIQAKWVNKFLKQFGQVHDKANRIHFKSLGGLLALQEEIGKQFLGRARLPDEVAWTQRGRVRPPTGA